MQDVERALADISDIRSQLAASTRFRGYAPEAVALLGGIALLMMVEQIAWPDRLAVDDRQQVLGWGAVLVLSSVAVAVEAVARAPRQHGALARSMLYGAVRTVVPITLTGAAIAVAVLTFAPAASWLIPGTWLMLIGLVAFSSYQTMPPAIVWPALWYLASGATVLLLAGRGGHITPWMMGVPLVVGHLAIARVLQRGGSDPDDR